MRQEGYMQNYNTKRKIMMLKTLEHSLALQIISNFKVQEKLAKLSPNPPS